MMRKIGDKTQALQAIVTAMFNLWSYYQYCIDKKINIIGISGLLTMLVSTISFVFDNIIEWYSVDILRRLIFAVQFIAGLIISIYAYSERYEEKFTKCITNEDEYINILAPNKKWERWDVINNNNIKDSVYINKKINVWLQSNELIGMQYDMDSTKRLHKYIKESERWNNMFRLFLKDNFRKVLYNGGQFYNEKKLGISKELQCGKSVFVHKTSYFDSYLTNIIPGKYLIHTANGKKIVECNGDMMPYKVIEANKKRILEEVGDRPRANEPGVTTICFTVSGYIYLWRQNAIAQSNIDLISASGSGSLDWNDSKKYLKDKNGFRKAIITGMNRELWEESYGNRIISREEFTENVETKILGYFRWLRKGGKAEFVGISRLMQQYLEGYMVPEKSEVGSGLCLNAQSIQTMRREIYRLIKNKNKKQGCSREYNITECAVSCAVALILVEEKCKEVCKECRMPGKYKRGDYRKCICEIQPYNALFHE